ncbi:MAG: hypothetical protein BIFFINMI_02703 [Phycisphaerae bacterium]|nr:hypothetical protein [Phycisphaerae bacterium]
MNGKKVLSRLLLAFVLVSVGVAIGRTIERNRSAGGGTVQSADQLAPTTQPTAGGGERKVIVYYCHATFRCATCNAIEAMTDELIRTEFADALASGRLEWKPVDYLQDERLAAHYSVGGNMIVVARFRDGREVGARRLDRVMELANDRAKFLDYLHPAIAESLKEGT